MHKFVVSSLLILAAASWTMGQTSAIATSPAPASQDAVNPAQCLIDLFADDTKARTAMVALRSTEDPQLLTLFAAFSRCSDRARRLYGTAAIGDLGKQEATALLQERLWKDNVPAIRAEALVGLLKRKALTPTQMAKALEIPEETIQCLAARALVAGTDIAARGNSKEFRLAVETLEKLTASRDFATAGLARLALLSIGRTDQLKPLEELIANPSVPLEAMGMILQQITEDKVAAAASLAKIVVKSELPMPLKLQAYRTLYAIRPEYGAEMVEAIRSSDHLVMRISLLRILTTNENYAAVIAPLAGEKDSLGTLVRFELAKAAIDPNHPMPEQQATFDDAVRQAVAMGHPIILDYILVRARHDVEQLKAKAGFYTTCLLELAKKIDPMPIQMGAEHIRAAMAVTLLANLGSRKALDAIREMLASPHMAVARVAASAMLRTTNKEACNLMQPYLESPLTEVATDAALAMGRHGDSRAVPYLQKMLSRHERHGPAMIAMAAWYYAKATGQGEATLKALAETVGK